MAKIVIDPFTRIEGHLKIEVVTEGGIVKEARCVGLLFRGLEIILRGRDPRDAQRITQRICGVCPAAHAMASSLALEDAFGVASEIPANGRLMRNLILGSNYLQSHILHFYHLAALDFVDVTAAAGYSGPDRRLRQVSDFIARNRSSRHRNSAILSTVTSSSAPPGKMPILCGILPPQMASISWVSRRRSSAST